MKKLERPGVQQHGGHLPVLFEQAILFIAAVRPVADDGVANMAEMFSDLMHAAGLGRYLNQ